MPHFETGASRGTAAATGRGRGRNLKRQAARWAARSGAVVTYRTGDERPAFPAPPAAKRPGKGRRNTP